MVTKIAAIFCHGAALQRQMPDVVDRFYYMSAQLADRVAIDLADEVF